MQRADELEEISCKLADYLERNPGSAEHAQMRISSVLASFASAATQRQPGTKRLKWSNKASRKGRNPAQFIREEYCKEYEAGELSLPTLRRYDPALYQAYFGWIRKDRHPEDDLNIPTRSDRATAELEALQGMDLESIERLHRLTAIARSRALRQRR